jgi:hypothetical protein
MDTAVAEAAAKADNRAFEELNLDEMETECATEFRSRSFRPERRHL